MPYKVLEGASIAQKYEPNTSVIILIRDDEGVVQKAITENSDVLNKLTTKERTNYISELIHNFLTEDLENYYDNIPDYVEPEYKVERTDNFIELKNTLEYRGELKVFIIASTKGGKGNYQYTYSDIKQRIKTRPEKIGQNR